MDTLKNTAHLNPLPDKSVPAQAEEISDATNIISPNSQNSILNIHANENLEKITRLLSERNLTLLKIIGSQKPKTLAELSRITGRPKASLTRTLARLAKLGIIVLSKSKGRGKTPSLTCDQLRLNINFI